MEEVLLRQQVRTLVEQLLVLLSDAVPAEEDCERACRALVPFLSGLEEERGRRVEAAAQEEEKEEKKPAKKKRAREQKPPSNLAAATPSPTAWNFLTVRPW